MAGKKKADGRPPFFGVPPPLAHDFPFSGKNGGREDAIRAISFYISVSKNYRTVVGSLPEALLYYNRAKSYERDGKLFCERRSQEESGTMALWEKKKSKKRVSNVLVFLLAFVLFLLVFGGLCLWAVVQINEERRSRESADSGLNLSETVAFTEEDARNILIVTTDGGEAQGFVAVRADPSLTRMGAVAFPRDMVVDYETSEIRLYELYREQGIAVTRTALEKTSGVAFDNYAVITYENIERVIDHFEAGLIFMLTEDLDYQGDGLSIQLDGGLKTLSSSQVVDVLRYPNWHGGRKQRAQIQAQITAALINQYMTSSRAEQADGDFSALVNLVNSDILVSHYNEAKPGLAYLASRNTGDICQVLDLEGEYQGSGDAIRFYAADRVVDRLEAAFG